MSYKILFNGNEAISPEEISNCIEKFGDSYTKAVTKIIRSTDSLDLNIDIFIKNSAILLNSFGMARSGSFQGIKYYQGKVRGPKNKLKACWDGINGDLLLARKILNGQNLNPRSRALVLLEKDSRTEVVSYIWSCFKKLLPITMGKTSYGLVGASKILFSVLPEIALPVDNTEWITVFKTVDFGDVIHTMADEITAWEEITGEQLQTCDYSENTTLPAVYNVMAMEARPKSK
jgi:hypothetical protein